VLPAGTVSHEIETFRAIPGAEVITLAGRDDPRPAQLRRPLRRLPVLGSPDRWTAALAWFEGLDQLDPGPVDAVVSLELFSATSAAGSRLARRLRVPHVVVIAEMLLDKPFYRVPPWRGYTKAVVRLADVFVCDTEMAADHAVALGCDPARTQVVYPGIDVELFRPAPPEERTTEPIVVSVGALRTGKGAQDVVAACDVVADRVPGLRLVLIGGGPLRREVEALAATRPHVEVRGPLSREAVASELARGRVFASAPYRFRFWAEQFGFALVEAAACGLPIVATDCGVIREVVPSHNRLVAERDIDGLAAGIVDALGPAGRRWGEANRQLACRRYDIRTQAARLAEILDGVR
jgi:glycosyltransferase involved in cell wall biosynthesis